MTIPKNRCEKCGAEWLPIDFDVCPSCSEMVVDVTNLHFQYRQTIDSLSKMIERLEAELAEAREKIEAYEVREGYHIGNLDYWHKRYDELIMAVQNKYPGETRHQTALRIITESECGTGQGGMAEAALKGGE